MGFKLPSWLKTPLDAGGVGDMVGLWGNEDDGPLGDIADPMGLFDPGGYIRGTVEGGRDEREAINNLNEQQQDSVETSRGRIPRGEEIRRQESDLYGDPEWIRLNNQYWEDQRRRNNPGYMDGFPGQEFEGVTQEDLDAYRNSFLGEVTGYEDAIDLEEVDPNALRYLGDPEDVRDQLTNYDPSLQQDSLMLGLSDGQSISGLRDIINEGGLTAIDRNRIAERRAGEDQWLRGQREATLANMQARGLGGSGAELASLFDQQQSSANRNYRGALGDEALALQRRDAALQGLFNMESDVAGAQDTVNRNNSLLATDAARWAADTWNAAAADDVHANRDAQAADNTLFNNTTIGNVNTRNDEFMGNYQDDWRQYEADLGLDREGRGLTQEQIRALQEQNKEEQGRQGETIGAFVSMFTGAPPGGMGGQQQPGGGGYGYNYGGSGTQSQYGYPNTYMPPASYQSPYSGNSSFQTPTQSPYTSGYDNKDDEK